jgi:glycerol-3-phosphate acyltransferase PlsX
MNTVRLAIDVESGDFGPGVIIAGVLDAMKKTPSSFKAYLCGDRVQIEQILYKDLVQSDRDKFEIIHCSDKILPDDKRTSAWKKRADSSIIQSIRLQEQGIVDASVSAGDTAILLGAALFILGRLDGAVRPALAAFLPKIHQKKPVLLLDVGANLDCRPEQLVSFGVLGSCYVNRYCEVETPAVALLNVGKEPSKGTRVIGDADVLLKKKCRNYLGFIEGNEVVSSDADVVVCDGFTGNVLLKAFESFYRLAGSMLENDQKLLTKVKSHFTVLDPESYGAVPFLGIKGTVLKAHGGSSSRAIANAVLTAITAVQRNAVWPTNARPKGC